MNRYRMIVDGRPIEVDLTELGPGRYRAVVDGTVHDVTLRDGMPAVSLAPVPLAMMPAPVALPAPAARPVPAAAAAPVPAPAPRHVPAPAPAPAPTPASAAAAPAGATPTIAGAFAVTAPMPGKVVAVLAKEGQKVARGAAIATIEAMKMNVPIVATTDGTLARLAVKVGDSLQAGQLVAEIKA